MVRFSNDHIYSLKIKKKDLIKVTEDDKNYLAILKPMGKNNEQEIDYYFSASWQPESGIGNKEEFIVAYFNKLF